jgi:hypothetical protein
LKKISFLISISLIYSALAAQSPQAFSYQAIARDNAGTILIINPLGIRISMVEGNKDGVAKYIETHYVTSNLFGIVNLVIGEEQVRFM